MNESTSTRAITKLRDELPSFAPVIDELYCYFDDDLSAHTVFGELADAANGLLTRPERDERDDEIVQAIFAALEAVATAPGVDPIEAVALGFLDALALGSFPRVLGYFHPVTEWLYLLLVAGAFDGWPDLDE